MARSRTEALRTGVLCAALACASRAQAAEPPTASPPAAAGAAVPAAPPASDACNEPLCYTASSLEAERNHIILHDLSLVDSTHGLVHIRADRAEASGLDLASSEWVLTGHVQVEMDQGANQHNVLHADTATVQFANKHVAIMTATGEPADFARTIDGAREPARGHAHSIRYDVDRNLVQLDGDSWLSDGCREIKAPHIDYDVTRQRVQAAAGGDSSQVHGTIRTDSGAQCAPDGGVRP
jgi:lipopolysaccharide transport protein LptA